MKNRIKLHLAMVAALATATFHRVTHPNALALGNTEASLTEPPQQQQQQQNNSAAALAEENEELRKKVAKLESALPKNSRLIKEKMAAGLSREQAEAAVRNQAAFDARTKEVARK